MADTPYNPYSPHVDDQVFGSGAGAASGHPNWKDGLPHGFKGWGPQTPDPKEEQAQQNEPQGELVWLGNEDDQHFTWRFDLRRHHHN